MSPDNPTTTRPEPAPAGKGADPGRAGDGLAHQTGAPAPFTNGLRDDPRSVLVDAMRIQTDDSPDRPHKDGGSVKPFDTIAEFWDTYVHASDGRIEGKDVAMMMVLFKVAREAYAHNRDNLVDIAGYAHCAQKMVDNFNPVEGGWLDTPWHPEERVRYVGDSRPFKHALGSVVWCEWNDTVKQWRVGVLLDVDHQTFIANAADFERVVE